MGRQTAPPPPRAPSRSPRHSLSGTAPGQPDRPAVSGPGGVRRRNARGRKAVFGGNQCGSAASSGQGPPGGSGGRGGGVARRGLTAVAAGSPGEQHGGREEGREAGGGWTRLGCGGAGGEARGGAAGIPSPSPGPGLPLTQPHGVRCLGRDSQCARRLRRRRRGRGRRRGRCGEAAAPAGGSRAEGPSRGRRGLRLQRTETAGGREHCAGAMRPTLSLRAGRGRGTRRLLGNRVVREGQPLLPPCLSDGGDGGARWGAARTVPLGCHSNKEATQPRKFTAVPRERSHLVAIATGNSPFLFP